MICPIALMPLVEDSINENRNIISRGKQYIWRLWKYIIFKTMLTRSGIYKDKYEKRVDPRGKVYYWMAGELITEPDDANTDISAVRNNLISVTPITYEMTRVNIMKDLETNLCSDDFCNWFK